jgi:hypothetical protein
MPGLFHIAYALSKRLVSHFYRAGIFWHRWKLMERDFFVIDVFLAFQFNTAAVAGCEMRDVWINASKDFVDLTRVSIRKIPAEASCGRCTRECQAGSARCSGVSCDRKGGTHVLLGAPFFTVNAGSDLLGRRRTILIFRNPPYELALSSGGSAMSNRRPLQLSPRPIRF